MISNGNPSDNTRESRSSGSTGGTAPVRLYYFRFRDRVLAERAGGVERGGSGVAVADILPECTGPEDDILNEAIFGWPKHLSASEVSRVTNDLRSITNEEQWYVLVSQINSCYCDGRRTVPTRAEN